MDNGVLIRDALPAELDAIEALVKEAYLEFRPLFPEQVWLAWMENVSRTVRAPGGMLIVAEVAGSIQGCVKFFPDASLAAMGHWPPGAGAIRIFAVLPWARGQGYGLRLTQEVLRRARDLKIPAIYLFTGEFMHAARHLYEKLGFRRAPEFDRHPGPIAYRLEL
jgi:ribosomal protein S18 acetylase RimI-like enzyme